jgi:APA family basic amino acid/polyamine antiporter
MRRALGPVQLTLFGIGAIIGAGIFATPGTAAAGDTQRPGAGPALMVSFALTAVVCSFTALCYAEFAAMVPISGSAYTYSYASLGELVAWIIGWDLIIEYAVGNIAVAISWANYFRKFVGGLGIYIPQWLAMDYRTAAKEVFVNEAGNELLRPDGTAFTVLDLAPHLFGYPIVFNALAVSIVALITLLLVIGIRESARFNAVMVCIKIVVLIFFIVVGSFWVKPANWHPFMPNGWAGVSAGAAIVFFAYIGFDAVSTVSEETRNPQRNLPIAILASLLICTVFYIVVTVVFTGLISYDELRRQLATQQAEPLTMALEWANPEATWAVGFVAFGSVIAHTAVLLVFQLGQPRIFMVMSRDGLLPPVFARIHPFFRTPHVATILTGIFVAAFAAVASIDEMVDLTNIGTLFAFILVCAGVSVLRVKDPNRPRPFRVPGGHVLPALGVLSCLYLIYYLPPTSWLRFAAWLNCGFVIYVGYGAVHSHLTGRSSAESPQRHDQQTAFLGVWLAVAGAVLLLGMHAFDVCLQGYKEHEALHQPDTKVAAAVGLATQGPLAPLPYVAQPEELMQRPDVSGHWAAAWDAVTSREAWLGLEGGLLNEMFWFLLLPLGLNALVLCPIVIRRALRARTERAMSTALAAGVLALVIVAYFGGVIAYNWS